MERAIIFAKDRVIGLNDLPGRVARADAGKNQATVVPTEIGQAVTLERLEAQHIRMVLDRSPSLEDAARILGIDPSTLYRKRKQLGL
jgi:NtrC-family two-component system response regulator AlgB